jgi:DNA-binding transcriptional ArsR family regulator
VRKTAAERLRVLGHPDRLRIVEVLSRRPTHVGEIAAQLGLPLATVSRHVRALRAVGIVESSQTGNRVLYVLSDREVPRLAAVAYRGAAVQARRLIAGAPDPSEDDLSRLDSAGG